MSMSFLLAERSMASDDGGHVFLFRQHVMYFMLAILLLLIKLCIMLKTL